MSARTAPPVTRVLRAYGGREAIDVARRELPDVIVLDLMMPEVNGFDVVEALKETPAIMEKAEFNPDRFTTEVRRAMSGRDVVA